MSVYYNGRKLSYVFNNGKKWRVTIDKTKEKTVIALKPVKSNIEKESSNS